MTIQKFFLAVGIYALAVPGLLLAVSDDFTITTIIGGDFMAPTNPVLLTAVPIASTQIDVTWSAATDDIAVAGYRLFRDSVQIATTTLLSYSDTGLIASTTYQYTLDAFDTSFNFSSTSLALSTTTLEALVPPTPTSTPASSLGSGTRTASQLISLAVMPAERSALFTWETNIPTQYVLRWGRTTAYELGSVSGSVYKQNHTTMIDALEPGTVYYYELRAINVRGQVSVLSTASFTTKSNLSPDSLPNVQGFTARTDNIDVLLTWQNTFSNPNFYVRVVRSHLFYPGTIESGTVVYEGRGQSFIDTDALAARSPQYYTIFVLDGTGAVSSGAIAQASRTVVPPTLLPGEPTVPGTVLPDIGDDTILRAADISLMQNEIMQVFDGAVTLTTNNSYLISIPYQAVARNLKSIIVTVQNPTNQREVSAYLLKLNQAGDAYVATIPGATVVGSASIMVEVFDYEQATIRRISTNITFVDDTLPVPFFPDLLLWYLKYIVLASILLWLIIWFIFLWRKRSTKDS